MANFPSELLFYFSLDLSSSLCNLTLVSFANRIRKIQALFKYVVTVYCLKGEKDFKILFVIKMVTGTQNLETVQVNEIKRYHEGLYI